MKSGLHTERDGIQANAVGNLFKRNSVYVSSIFVGAFAFGIGFDTAMTKWWEVRANGWLLGRQQRALLADSADTVLPVGPQPRQAVEGHPREGASRSLFQQDRLGNGR